MITSQELARKMLAHPGFSARSDLRRVAVGASDDSLRAAAPGEFINMDRPEHARYRRLLTRYFTARGVQRHTAWITDVVREHLAAVAAAGPTTDLVQSFALPVPAQVISRLLGVPEKHRAAITERSTMIANATGPGGRALAGFGALTVYLRKLCQFVLQHPGDDLLSALGATGELTEEELTNIAVGMFLGGHETTSNMIALGMFALLEHPDQLARLRREPELLDPAIEELLRYLTITHIGLPYRAALRDVELGGELIREGETVTVGLPVANRDPAVFENPDDLLLDRSNAGRHLAFGHGVHQCLGQHLARLELRIAYRELLHMFPDARLAVPAAEITMRESSFIYGPAELPVILNSR